MGKQKIIAISSGIILTILVVLLFGIKLYAEKTAKERIDEAIAGVSSFASVKYNKVSTGFFGGNVRVSGITVTTVVGRLKRPPAADRFLAQGWQNNLQKVAIYGQPSPCEMSSFWACVFLLTLRYGVYFTSFFPVFGCPDEFVVCPVISMADRGPNSRH